MSITAMGMGSGLDIAGIVRQLVAAEKAPRQERLDQREKSLQSQLSALGRLKSSLANFQTKLAGLKDGTSFNTRLATSSNENALRVTADAKVQPGSYEVEVERLARAHRVNSIGFTAGEAVNPDASKLTFVVPEGDPIEVNIAAGSTLAQVRDEINREMRSAGAGVSATIISVDGDEGRVDKLVLTATETGSANAIDVQGAFAAALGFEPLDRDAESIKNLDARIKVDGHAVTHGSNRIDDVIQGVTLELQPGSAGETSTVAINLDNEGAAKGVQAFIDAYNALSREMKQLTRFDVETGARGPLVGDSTVRSVSSFLQRELSQPLDGELGSLMALGIEYERDGTLRLNETKFNEALAADFDGVHEAFAGAAGLATRLDVAADQFLKRDGILNSRESGAQASLRRLEDDRAALNRYIERFEERTRRQFINLDIMVGQIQSTSEYLTQQLANLPFNNMGKKR